MLLLDEPSSALDALAEGHLMSGLLKRDLSRSVVLVTHRLSSARRADMIVVLDHGRITEVGAHSQLIIQTGRYRQMWEAQMGDERQASLTE